MRTTAAHRHHVSPSEGLDDPGTVARILAAMTKFAVVAFAPTVNVALSRKCQAVLAAGVDAHLYWYRESGSVRPIIGRVSHLLDKNVLKGLEQGGLADGINSANAQATSCAVTFKEQPTLRQAQLYFHFTASLPVA